MTELEPGFPGFELQNEDLSGLKSRALPARVE